jgi:hypothetical protein
MGLVYDNYRHSPASGNMFLAAPDAFVWRYGLKNWQEEDSARQAMGHAAEFAVHAALIGNITDDEAVTAIAQGEFDKRMNGVVSEEREAVGDIARNMLRAMRNYGPPLTYQHKITLNGALYGLRRDIVVKMDFGYENFIIDTKATLRCPSSLKPDHARQMAAYAMATGKLVKALYATPKKFAEYAAENVEHNWRLLLASWRAIEALDGICEAPGDALRFIPHNPDTYYWDDATRSRAIETWRLA